LEGFKGGAIFGLEEGWNFPLREGILWDFFLKTNFLFQPKLEA